MSEIRYHYLPTPDEPAVLLRDTPEDRERLAAALATAYGLDQSAGSRWFSRADKGHHRAAR